MVIYVGLVAVDRSVLQSICRLDSSRRKTRDTCSSMFNCPTPHRPIGPLRSWTAWIRSTSEIPGVADSLSIAGYSLLGGYAGSNLGFSIIILDPWDERQAKEVSIECDRQHRCSNDSARCRKRSCLRSRRRRSTVLVPRVDSRWKSLDQGGRRLRPAAVHRGRSRRSRQRAIGTDRRSTRPSEPTCHSCSPTSIVSKPKPWTSRCNPCLARCKPISVRPTSTISPTTIGPIRFACKPKRSIRASPEDIAESGCPRCAGTNGAAQFASLTVKDEFGPSVVQPLQPLSLALRSTVRPRRVPVPGRHCS